MKEVASFSRMCGVVRHSAVSSAQQKQYPLYRTCQPSRLGCPYISIGSTPAASPSSFAVQSHRSRPYTEH